MKEQYRIVLIVPTGYVHAHCFTEIAFLLKNSLQDLGNPCDIAINEFAKDRTNVVLGYHLLAAANYIPPFRYIPYQFEQLSAAEGVFSDKVKALLEGGAVVWDYSPENIAFLAGHGIAARHLPVGYHPALEMIPKDIPKDIDVLFFGSMAERRKKILDALDGSGAKVKSLFGVYGKQRDSFIARAKIVLNIHFYSSKIFEAVRTSYLFNNARCVVSEASDVYAYPAVSAKLVDYENLPEACLELLRKDGETEELGEKNYEEFRKNYVMKEMVRAVLI